MNRTASAAQRKIAFPDFLKSDRFVMICIYCGTLLIHSLMSLCVTIFNLTPDEYSVAAIAAYLNGYDWSSTVSTGGYYGYFQGLLYAPAFLLTDDPFMQYKLMVLLNGAVMSFAPVIAYHLGRKTFELGKGTSLLFSLISGLYPCYMLLTKYTWNETMCSILPWIFLLLCYKALECTSTVRKQIFSVLGGLTLVAAYATHGRMLALTAAGVVLVLVVFFAMKKRIFCLTGFFASFAVALAADKFLKDLFQNALWLLDESGGTPTNTIEKMVSRILDADMETIGNFFKALIGHFFYFISSTWGFGAICVTLIIGSIVMFFRRRYEIGKAVRTKAESPEAFLCDNDAILAIFTFLAMGAVFVVSVAFKGTSTVLAERADTLIYGRYTEVFYPIAIYCALLLICRGKLTLMHSLSALAGAAVINVLTMTFVAPVVTAAERMVSGMILGIAPIRYAEKMKDIPTDESFYKIIISTMLILLVFVIIQILRKNDARLYQFFAFPLAGLLLYTNIFCYTGYTVPQSKNALNGAVYMQEAIDRLEGSGFDTLCMFALAKERQVKAQFIYPDTEFVVAGSFSALTKLEERPDFILSDREDNLNLWVNDVYLVGDINSEIHVYACTAEAYEWAKQQGLARPHGGYVHYFGTEIPATDTVEKTETAAVMPNKSAVYTNYSTLYKAGTYYFTAEGENVGLKATTITLTSDKGANDLEYTVSERADDRLVISLTVERKTENVRLKLSNNNGVPVTIDSMELLKDDSVAEYNLAQGATYTRPVV